MRCIPLALTLALGATFAQASTTVNLLLQPQQLIDVGGSRTVTFDIRGWAEQTFGKDVPWQVLAGGLTLNFEDDSDVRVDRGLTGPDGSAFARTARRETRDGMNGIVVYETTTHYTARSFENPQEIARIGAIGLSGEARSTGSSRSLIGGTQPVQTSSSWSGWTCHPTNCVGVQTIAEAAERHYAVDHGGAFSFASLLQGEALQALSTTGLWTVTVGAEGSDLWWRSARLSLDVVAAPVPEPGTAALLALGIAAVGLRRRRAQR